MNPYILLIAGLVMVFLEFYLPGAVLGTIGALLVFAAIIYYVIQSDSALYSLIFTVVSLASLGVLIKFALWRIRSTKKDQSIYSDDSQEGFFASKTDASLIGKKAKAATDMRPGGHVIVEGKRFAAISTGGYVLKDEDVLITGGEEESLIVKPIKEE